MYTFEHDATGQTPALIDYRYIGDDPYNYVKFNNEIWRIIGVFKVEDKTGNMEYKIKIIRNDRLSETISYHDSTKVDWQNTSLSIYLNNEYLDMIDQKYRDLISDSKYFLGTGDSASDATSFYNYERGNVAYSNYNIY